jgi:translation initiation factor 4E
MKIPTLPFTHFYYFLQGNCNGGQWVVRLNKGLAARCWENLILAILGEQFNVGDEICGAGVSMRQKKDCISLWHKTSSDTEACERVREGMRKVLNLPSHIQMEYRNHKDVLHWTRERDGKVRPGSPTHMMERERGSSLGPLEGNPRRDTGGAVGGAPGMPPPR